MFHRELADFLQRLKSERRLSPHTVTGYQRDLNALIGFCERERIETFDALDSYQVRRFAAESHRRGLNARSIARRLSAVRTFLPINEPLTTARFAGLYGWWDPGARDDGVFARLIVAQCLAIREATRQL